MKPSVSQLFKDWMIETGKAPTTANNYASGVNTVSNDYGRDVFEIDSIDDLEQVYQIYSPGGARAAIGGSNSGNVYNGLKQWLEFRRTQLQLSPGLAPMDLEGYADPRVRQLLNKGTAHEQAWVRTLLGIMRQSYPQADHWTVNVNPSDIRIGVRQLNALKGKPVFSLYWDWGKIRCSLRKVADHRELMETAGLAWEIESDACPTAAEIKEWLDSVDDVLGERGLTLNGSSFVPLDYHQSEQEEFTMAAAASVPALNQILFGPPGTGKTYATIDSALKVLDPAYLDEQLDNREALKQRFDELVGQDRIRFVTFHQSFSYEDFVEGLRATTDEATQQLRYEVVDGVFKSLCEAAAAKVTQQAEAPTEVGQRRIWKMSLGNTLGEDASIYQECLAGDYVLLGYGDAIDFSGCTSRQQVQERFAAAGVKPESPATDYGITSVTAFVARMKVGDLIVVSDGNFKFRAIGEVTGDYLFKPHAEYEAGYSQMRPVKWLRQYQPSLPHTELLNGQFSQMTLYELKAPTLNRDKLKALLGAPEVGPGALLHVGQRFSQGYVVRSVGQELVELDKPKGGVLPLPLSLLRQLLAYVRSGQITVEDIRRGRVFEKVPEAEMEKHMVNGYQHVFAPMVEQLLKPQASSAVTDARVLIIDEINRGNISRIFGELITLIEPSKRAGEEEALSVVLPYSKQRFSVPSNLHLIGTMNTTDRSLAGLDMALRRRFVFQEMPPRPELLDDVVVQGLNIGQLLRVMNQRIEVLLDRDHCLGHAYFMPLKDDGSLERLEAIFRSQILPLLQEYFFEDWQRIQWVFNDHRKLSVDRFVVPDEQDLTALFGDISVPAQGPTWRINHEAFKRISAYFGVIAANTKVVMPAEVFEEAGA